MHTCDYHVQLQAATRKIEALEAELKNLKATTRICNCQAHAKAPNPRVSHSSNRPVPEPRQHFEVPPELTRQGNKFYASLPLSEEDWISKRQSLGLDNLKSYIEFFQQVISLRTPQRSPNQPRNQSPELQVQLKACLEYLRALRMDSRRSKQVYNYGLLSYISLLRTLLKSRRISTNEANELMREIFSQDGKASDSYLANIRSSTAWPVNIATKLRKRGFGNRADELFVLCGCTMSAYQQLQKDKALTKRFDNVELPRNEQEYQNGVSLSVGFIVKIFYPNLSAAEINDTLETSHSDEEFNSLSKKFWEITCTVYPPLPPATEQTISNLVPNLTKAFDSILEESAVKILLPLQKRAAPFELQGRESKRSPLDILLAAAEQTQDSSSNPVSTDGVEASPPGDIGHDDTDVSWERDAVASSKSQVTSGITTWQRGETVPFSDIAAMDDAEVLRLGEATAAGVSGGDVTTLPSREFLLADDFATFHGAQLPLECEVATSQYTQPLMGDALLTNNAVCWQDIQGDVFDYVD
ncbi:unnamed protein product [Clonostachys rosea f. rosea IK726]|uniref:Uncharacterized protein n=1 Tax=Clonostachys rosea f. rosea IK726 TaxID=1349383 RepID=A0ACA9TER6_BIOOC|nr:unnamed protein product [Clonostachys rosea f. rosea IK726]